MKKLINQVEDVVTEALAGMQALHPELLHVDFENQIIVRRLGGVLQSISGCYGSRDTRRRTDDARTSRSALMR